MRKVTGYFIVGFILQLLIIANIVYWFSLVSSMQIREAIDKYAANLPSFLQDTTVVLIICGAIVIASMMCYGLARKLSVKSVFRNMTMGLILLNAILLLWMIFALM
jgi:hypothetical protein